MPKQSWQPCWSCGTSIASGTRRCPRCGASQVREQTDHLAGRYVGAYQLVRRIGHGGMGMVYEAAHSQTGYHYALKVLHPQICEDEVMIERLRREAQIASTLRHKHLVEVYEMGFDEGVGHFVVMELLQGDELASLMLNFPVVSLGRVREIVSQVCDGLELAHRHNVVHRDLKPGNIFLLQPESGYAYVKLLDFGIARLFAQQEQAQQLTGMGSSLGTPDYMPPEQIMGKLEKISPASDIYSLSVVIFRMLTGVLPLDGRNLLKLLNQVMFKKPPRLSDFAPIFRDSWLEELLYQGMAKHPHERPQTIEEFGMRFDEALEGDPRLYPLLEEGKQAGWAPNHQVSEQNKEEASDSEGSWEEQERPASFTFGGETYRFEGSELISDSSDHMTAISRAPELSAQGGAEDAVDASLEQDLLYGGGGQSGDTGGNLDVQGELYPHPAMSPDYLDDDEGPTRVNRQPASASQPSPMNQPAPISQPSPMNQPAPMNQPSPLNVAPAGADLQDSGPTRPLGLRVEGLLSPPAERSMESAAAGYGDFDAPASGVATKIVSAPKTTPPPETPDIADKIDEPTRSVRIQRNGPPASLLAPTDGLLSPLSSSDATALLKPSEATVMLPSGSSVPVGGGSIKNARGSGTTVERKVNRVPKPGGFEATQQTEGDTESPQMTTRVRLNDAPPPAAPSGLGSLMLGFLFGVFLIAGVLTAWWLMRGFLKDPNGTGGVSANQTYRLEIRSQPQGARIMVQGRFLGNTPFIVERKAGEILDFVVIKNGYSMAAETWEAQKDETRRVILLKTQGRAPSRGRP
ncbi:MAG: protein kinase [Myxococcales bacterium]|nr:protein kinase [Myxococcales bacterium]